MENIYHVVTSESWAQFKGKTEYFADSLATEGFIHCSNQQQVEGVLERYYTGQSNLLLLQINPAKLTSKLVYEAPANGTELFPHVYGTINFDAIEIIEEI